MTRLPNDTQQQLSLEVHPFAEPPINPDFDFLKPLRTTKVFATYWRFAVERQSILMRRLNGDSAPWTADPILQKHKFTNAYRATDRVSQFLIKSVIYSGSETNEEVFFRTILFKIFNKIETWQLLTSTLGPLSYRDYSFSIYDAILSNAINSGVSIYSGAYIMPSGGSKSLYKRKHQMHLKLLERMMSDGLPKQIHGASSMAEVFGLLRAYPTIGDFLAFQYAIDLNYGPLTDFDEMDFVVAGPGAKDGIKKCFSDSAGLDEERIIREVTAAQNLCFEAVKVSFPFLGNRKLQLIDCQNLFCEVDKYARVAHPDVIGLTGRLRIKQTLKPKKSIPSLWLPPKWGINNSITDCYKHV